MWQKLVEKLNSIDLRIMAFVVGIVVGIAIGTYQPSPHEYYYEEVVIKPGDTLWDLTKAHSSNEINIQELIHATNIANNISGNISPGQKIKLAISIKK